MIKQVKGLRIGDKFECTSINLVKDIEFKVTSFPNRKTVKGKQIKGIKRITVSIKNIESEHLKS